MLSFPVKHLLNKSNQSQSIHSSEEMSLTSEGVNQAKRLFILSLFFSFNVLFNKSWIGVLGNWKTYRKIQKISIMTEFNVGSPSLSYLWNKVVSL